MAEVMGGKVLGRTWLDPSFTVASETEATRNVDIKERRRICLNRFVPILSVEDTLAVYTVEVISLYLVSVSLYYPFLNV